MLLQCFSNGWGRAQDRFLSGHAWMACWLVAVIVVAAVAVAVGVVAAASAVVCMPLCAQGLFVSVAGCCCAALRALEITALAIAPR